MVLVMSHISMLAQNTAVKVEVTGHGPDIIFLPGFGCPGDVWKELVNSLSEDFTCHVFSYAGFNKVPPIEGNWLESIKNELESYIIEGTTKPHVIGHSLGGTLALQLASEGRVNISRVINVDGLASVGAQMIPNFSSDMLMHDSQQNKQMLSMSESQFAGMVQFMSRSMVMDSTYHTLISNWMEVADRKTYVYGYTDLLKLDLREDLRLISIPVTIIAAVHPYGKETVVNTFREQFKNLNDYSIFYAENSAHFVMFDQPEWLEKIILEIINE